MDSTVSGQLATRFHLSRGWSLRGAWGYSEKPPLVGALTATTIVTNPRVRDPLTGRRYTVPSVNLGNPNLESEETRTVSAGLSGKLGPVAVSADWYAAELSNVLTIFSTQAILNLEAQDPSSVPAGVRVVRYPPPAPPDVWYVIKPVSGAGTIRASGIHLRGDTGWKTDWADMDLGVNWSYLRQYDRAASTLTLPSEFPRNRFRAVLGAERGQLRAHWSVYGRSSYWNLDRSGRYEKWIGHDLALQWRNPFHVQGTEIVGGVTNVADRGPAVNSADPGEHDSTLDSIRGRTWFLSLKKTW